MHLDVCMSCAAVVIVMPDDVDMVGCRRLQFTQGMVATPAMPCPARTEHQRPTLLIDMYRVNLSGGAAAKPSMLCQMHARSCMQTRRVAREGCMARSKQITNAKGLVMPLVYAMHVAAACLLMLLHFCPMAAAAAVTPPA